MNNLSVLLLANRERDRGTFEKLQKWKSTISDIIVSLMVEAQTQMKKIIYGHYDNFCVFIVHLYLSGCELWQFIKEFWNCINSEHLASLLMLRLYH